VALLWASELDSILSHSALISYLSLASPLSSALLRHLLVQTWGKSILTLLYWPRYFYLWCKIASE